MKTTNTVLVLLVILLTAGCASPTPVLQPTETSQPEPTPTVTVKIPPLAAAVNGEWILLDDHRQEVNRLLQAAQELGLTLSEEQANRQAFDALVEETLLAQAAFKAGWEISEDELVERLQRLQAEAGGEEDFARWMQENSIPAARISELMERSLAAAWQRDRIAAGVPEQVEQVRARQLVFAEEDTAREVHRQLTAGRLDFEDAAFDLDPYTGGDLGWFPRGLLYLPELEQAAFELEPGQVSDVIQTRHGYHILTVLERKEKELMPTALRKVQSNALEDWLESEKASAVIENHLGMDLSDGDQTLDPAGEAGPLVYRVKDGDNFYSVARQFHLAMDALAGANPEINPEMVGPGTELVIPGITGAADRVDTVTLPDGMSLAEISRAARLPEKAAAGLNRLASPLGLYAGQNVVLTEEAAARLETSPLHRVGPLQLGETWLEAAVRYGLNPWTISLLNQAQNPVRLMSDHPLFLPVEDTGESGSPFSSLIISPEDITQGSTVVVHMDDIPGAALSGWLDGHPLHFQLWNGEWIAIQGIHAMAAPGLAEFSLRLVGPDGGITNYERMIPLYAGEFVEDIPLTVDPETIDPAVTGPEEQLVQELVSPVTPEKYWSGPFQRPVDEPACLRSWFGNRRSFNGSPYIYYHAGVDYGPCSSTNVLAAAPGVVVYTGALTVRGNATIIDHGWGIYTGYWHQEEILVQVGDRVQAGQVIGKIGATGRVTGEHLHFEIWANGVQVSPVEWLVNTYP